MAATTTGRGRMRRLAEIHPDNGRVLSVFFDLDPAEFATGEARASEITSVCDQAGKLVEDRKDELTHDELIALREDVQRVRGLFDPQRMGQGGARGIAVFACGPIGLLETVRTAHPVDSRVVIGDTPYVEPLVALGERERWVVALVNSRHGRIFTGNEDGFEELGDVRDDTHGQHRQGGWSYRRYANTVEDERRDHLDNVSRRLLDLLRTRPFDRLIVGGPEPVDDEFIGRLHPYLRDRLAGKVSVDVDTASAAAVAEAAVPVFEQQRHDHEHEVIERLRAGIGQGPDGRAVGGLPDVLEALNEQRVEVLLLEPNLTGRGWVDPQTGYLAAEPGPAPTGGELQEREDVVEAAIERAIEQSAEVLVLRDQPDLGPHGGVAAVLRF